MSEAAKYTTCRHIFSIWQHMEQHEVTLIDLYQTPLPFYTPEDDGDGSRSSSSI